MNKNANFENNRKIRKTPKCHSYKSFFCKRIFFSIIEEKDVINAFNKFKSRKAIQYTDTLEKF